MTPEQRMIKLFKWGTGNNVAICLLRFKQVYANKKDFRHLWEVTFKEVSNDHRSSRGTSEDMNEAMDLVWKDYKRKRRNEN